MAVPRTISIALVTLLMVSAFLMAPVTVDLDHMGDWENRETGTTSGTETLGERETNKDVADKVGMLQVFLTDAPLDDVQNVIVRFEGVDVHSDTTGWTEISTELSEIDLLELQDGATEMLAVDELPAGNYTQIRLRLVSATLVLNDTIENVTIPSGFQSGVKINPKPPIEVKSGQATKVVLDFDAERSLHFAPGKGWIMRPVVKAVWTSVEPIFYIDQSQLLALELLDNASALPLEIRFGEAFGVPEFIAGQWATDPALPSPEEKAGSFFDSYRDLFKMTFEDSFVYIGLQPSRFSFTNLRFQQYYGTVPVFGAEHMVNMVRDNVLMVHGTFVPGIDIGITPTISQGQAEAIVESDVQSKWGPSASIQVEESELVVFNPKVINRFAPRYNVLAWYVRVTVRDPPGHWSYFVNAQTGEFLSSWDEARLATYPSEVYDSLSNDNRTDDKLWYQDGTKQDPGTPPSDVQNLDTFEWIYYSYLSDKFGWDSIDNNGMRMIGRANYWHVNMSANNACWGCGYNDVVFNAGMITQDVVSHEFSHGLVEMSAGGLKYAAQSGALHEHFADIFAEFLDCQAQCNWKVGQDLWGNVASSGILRDVADPTVYNHPDHLGVLNIAIDPCGKDNDNCYVHSNNGVPNKAAYLISEGGTHYGITVYGMGVLKAEQLVFATLMDIGLTWTATFNEYRDVMLKACQALMNTPIALTTWNCRQVERAWLSVGFSHLTQAIAGQVDESYDNFGRAMASGDFNGDSYDDLAVSVPFESFLGKVNTGIVLVFNGFALGLGAGGTEFIAQYHVGAATEDNDRFGWSLAVGNFNGDAYDDLAIGVPYESVGTTKDAGVVNILYGTSNGLIQGGSAWWERLAQEDSSGISEEKDKFGWAVTAGNFNGDSYDDLAVSTPYEDIFLKTEAGKVDVFYGSSQGLLSGGGFAIWETFTNDDSGGVVEDEDRYGLTLSSGDFDGDSYDDLVVGHPHEDQGGIPNAGHVSILYGSSSGLDPVDWLVLGEGLGGGAAEAYDNFGYSLTTGDFDNDGYDDLVVGIPYENFGATSNTGAVTVFYGSSSGLYPTEWVRLDWSLMYGQPSQAEDKYGWALEAGDFDGDGYDDLAVGIPYDDYSGFTNNGGVHYYYGSSNGLYPPTMDFGGQTYLGGLDESDDHFGYALAAGDFNNEGMLDLAISAPAEDVFGGAIDAGAVYVREF